MAYGGRVGRFGTRVDFLNVSEVLDLQTLQHRLSQEAGSVPTECPQKGGWAGPLLAMQEASFGRNQEQRRVIIAQSKAVLV